MKKSVYSRSVGGCNAPVPCIIIFKANSNTSSGELNRKCAPGYGLYEEKIDYFVNFDIPLRQRRSLSYLL